MSGRHPAHEFRDRLHGRGDLPLVGELPGATGTRVAVALALANCADRNGIASPGVAYLARLCACSSATVRRALDWTLTVGLVERVGGGHRGRATEYRLVVGKVLTSEHQSEGKVLTGEHKGAHSYERPTSGTSREGPAPSGGADPYTDDNGGYYDPFSLGALALAPANAAAHTVAAVRRLRAVAGRQLRRHEQAPGQRTLPLWVPMPDHGPERTEEETG